MLPFVRRKWENNLYSNIHDYSLPREASTTKQSWRPTWFQPRVFLGLASLLVSALAMVASFFVLLLSDRQPVRSWPVQPTVYLAIASAIAAMALRFAKTRAAPVSWWHHALMGSKIRDLEGHWESSQTFFGAVASLRTATGMSLATLLAILMVIDSALLQRASSVITATISRDASLSFTLAPEIPIGFSGIAPGGGALMFWPRVENIFAASLIGTSMTLKVSGCEVGATCTPKLHGPGVVEESCTEHTVPLSVYNLTHPDSDWSGGPWSLPRVKGFPLTMAQPIFDVYLEAMYTDKLNSDKPELAKLETKIANFTTRGGRYTERTCIFTPAVLEYDVEFQQQEGDATMSRLLTGNVIHKVNNTHLISVHPNHTLPVTLTGFYDLIASVVAANVSAAMFKPYQPGYRWTPDQATMDAEAAKYFVWGGNGVFWKDPKPSVIDKLNDLMLRGAIVAGQWSNVTSLMDDGLSPRQNVAARQTTTESVFHTDLRWFAGAAVLDVVAVLAVLPLFWGWWRLPRNLSQSPFQLALAFEAPLLQEVHSTAGATGVMNTLGNVKVAFGASAPTQIDSHIETTKDKIMVREKDQGEGNCLRIARVEDITRPCRQTIFTR